MQNQNLSFDEETHIYKVAGTKLPSVTKIVAALTGKDLSGIPPAILEAAKNRGVAIHKDVENGTLQTEEGKWVEKHLVRENCQFEIMGNGEVNGLAFAGRADIIEGSTLWDVKTEAKPDVLSWSIQLNLYRVFLPGIERLAILHAPKSGTYKVFELDIFSPEKMNELVTAYNEGRIIDKTFLEDSEAPKQEEISLELIVTEHDKGHLICNSKTLLENVRRKMFGYNAENYTEDNIDEAKKDKAILNKSADLIDSLRKQYEADHMASIQLVITDLKIAVKEIKEGSAKIDVLCKTVEARDKEVKKERLKAHFLTLAYELVSFEKIFKQEWLNKTAKEIDSKNAITAAVLKHQQDLEILDRIGEPEAKLHYMDTLDVNASIAMADRLKENKKILEAAKAIPEVIPESVSNPVQIAENVEKLQDSEPEAIPFRSSGGSGSFATSFGMSRASEIKKPEPKQEEEILERVMMVRGTREQLIGLSEYMNTQNIFFEKIEEGV